MTTPAEDVGDHRRMPMESDGHRDVPDSPQLINPYLDASASAVWGVTLGRIGVAAGVIAVATAGPAVGAEPVTGSTEIWLGTGAAVDQEIAEQSMPAGYLWPAPPVSDASVSPALEVPTPEVPTPEV
jgi:hypothetical protein